MMSRRDQKRQRFELKQRQQSMEQQKEDERRQWTQNHPDAALWVDDVSGNALDDLIAPYKNLKEGGKEEGLFIAEGTETVRLLLRQSALCNASPVPINLLSILVKPSVFFDEPVMLRRDTEAVLNKKSFKVLLANEKTLSEIAGFQISRGCLACGVIPSNLDEASLLNRLEKRQNLRILAVDGVSDTANLGSLIRTSSAMGMNAVVLSKDSCDAWYRRTVRVSMGHVGRIPTIRVENLAAALKKLSVTCYAAVVGQESLHLGTMKHGDVPSRWCCVVGNEGNGISEVVVEACHHALTIEMDNDVDSLSLPVAAGILLNGLREREGV